jgi:hypothetical protein
MWGGAECTVGELEPLIVITVTSAVLEVSWPCLPTVWAWGVLSILLQTTLAKQFTTLLMLSRILGYLQADHAQQPTVRLCYKPITRTQLCHRQLLSPTSHDRMPRPRHAHAYLFARELCIHELISKLQATVTVL